MIVDELGGVVVEPRFRRLERRCAPVGVCSPVTLGAHDIDQRDRDQGQEGADDHDEDHRDPVFPAEQQAEAMPAHGSDLTLALVEYVNLRVALPFVATCTVIRTR